MMSRRNEIIHIQQLFQNNYLPVLNKIVESFIGDKTKYYLNIIIWSFRYKNLLPVFNINNQIEESIFKNLIPLLEEFSFTKAIVDFEKDDICVFDKLTFQDFSHWSFWSNYFGENSINLINKKETIEKISKKFFEEVIFEDNNINQISIIPLINGTVQKKTGGVISIYSSNEIDRQTTMFLQKLFSGVISPIPIQELEYIELLANRRAAIAQVMLRNMSHNLGSHVLANLTQSQTILNIALGNATPNFSTSEELKKNQLIYKNENGLEINISSNPKSFDVAISELSSYLRTRMDFLADISTGTAVIETTKKLVYDVTEPFKNRNFLLKEYITGNNKRVIFSNPNSSIVASFPNDNLSVQAIYVIIENVIRNSAKHSKSNKNVSISWEYSIDKNSDLIELIIYDKNDPKEINELNDLISRQNDRINKEILESGVLRHGSWGMLEMKIAAAYLRKIPVEKIDDKYVIPLLMAVPVPENKSKYLGYKFFLLKPKHVLIITNDNVNIDLQDEYKQHGISVKSLSETNENTETYGHDILLLIDIKPDVINNVLNRLPSRIICTDLENFNKKQEATSSGFIDWLWHEWFDIILNEYNPVVVIKSSDDSGIRTNEVSLTGNSLKTPVKAEFVYHCKTFRDETSYFEPYSSLYPAKEQVNNLKYNCTYELKSRFLETINYNVAIVDERIQKHGEISFDGGIIYCNKKHLDFLEKCGIFLPQIEIDLNAETFNLKNGEQTIKEKLEDWIRLKVETCTFLVIHIGILERMLELNNLKDDEKLSKIEEYLLKVRQIKNLKAKIIITSGRGQPETLPKGERFVHYSNIAQYIIEKRSKFHLIQLLMSARETK